MRLRYYHYTSGSPEPTDNSGTTYTIINDTLGKSVHINVVVWLVSYDAYYVYCSLPIIFDSNVIPTYRYSKLTILRLGMVLYY